MLVGTPYYPNPPAGVDVSPEMLEAGATIINSDCEESWTWSRHVAKRVYLAMLGAAEAAKSARSLDSHSPERPARNG
jgi:hypothetical protein